MEAHPFIQEGELTQQHLDAMRTAGEYTSSIRRLLEDHGVKLELQLLDELLSDAYERKYVETLTPRTEEPGHQADIIALPNTQREEAVDATEVQLDSAAVEALKKLIKNNRQAAFLNRAFPNFDLTSLTADQISTVFDKVMDGILENARVASTEKQVSRVRRWAAGMSVSDIAQQDWVTRPAVSITKTNLEKRAGEIADINKLVADLTHDSAVAVENIEDTPTSIQTEDLIYDSLRDVILSIRDDVRAGRWFSDEGRQQEIDSSESDIADHNVVDDTFELPEDFDQEVARILMNSSEPIHIGFIVRRLFQDRLPRENFKKVLNAMSNLCRSGAATYLGDSRYKSGQRVVEFANIPTGEEMPVAEPRLQTEPRKNLSKMLHEAGIHDTPRPARRRASGNRRRGR